MAKLDLETTPDFDPYYIKDMFEAREQGWKVDFVKTSDVDLTPIDPGSAIECGDERFDFIKRKLYGAKLFGQSNGICALVTGGSMIGLYRGAYILDSLGLTSGTHRDCGAWMKWYLGELDSVDHPFDLPIDTIAQQGLDIGDWIESEMEALNGKHFDIPKIPHSAQALRWNSFKGMTEKPIPGALGYCFKVDASFQWQLGMPINKRVEFNAEIVEKLKPDAKKLEIIIP